MNQIKVDNIIFYFLKIYFTIVRKPTSKPQLVSSWQVFRPKLRIYFS